MGANLEGHDARVWQAVYNGGQLVHILWRIAEGHVHGSLFLRLEQQNMDE